LTRKPASTPLTPTAAESRWPRSASRRLLLSLFSLRSAEARPWVMAALGIVAVEA
jgi:hypothetical protein